jgi:hypothetical protein
MLAVMNRDDGEALGSLLTLLSFNTFHIPDFASLACLLRNHRPPTLAFIQEVSQFSSLPRLRVTLGYSAFLSTSLELPKQTSAVLGCCLAQMRELTLGYSQFAAIGHVFIYLHLPLGGGVVSL